MTVTWTTLSKANGVITHYEVEVGTFPTQTSGTTSHTQRGLTPFQVYLVKVRACTKPGCGLFSQIPVKTNEATPNEAPGRFQNTATNSRSVTLPWKRLEDRNIRGVLTRYELKYTNGRSSPTVTDPVTDGSKTVMYTLLGLEPFTTYSFTVAACTAKGCGPLSAIVSVKSKQIAPDEVRKFRVGTVSNVSAQLAWEKLTVVGGILTGYKIAVSTSGAPAREMPMNAKAVRYTVRNLQPFTDYIFSIVAVTEGGEGAPTSAQKRTCQGFPLQTSLGLKSTRQSDTSIDLVWNPLSERDAKGYVVKYSF